MSPDPNLNPYENGGRAQEGEREDCGINVTLGNFKAIPNVITHCAMAGTGEALVAKWVLHTPISYTEGLEEGGIAGVHKNPGRETPGGQLSSLYPGFSLTP
ncbi:hypothetical protein GCM10017687_39010 [Streptomyces echinatus]